MTTRALAPILCVLVLGLAACEDERDTPDGVDSGPIEIDSGPAPVDARDPALPSCDYPQPGPIYGTDIFRPFRPFELEQCDGTPYNFYNQEFCDSTLTVISIAAGWCGPCIYESMNLTEQVTEMYRAQGVRVIQVLVQDEDYNEASGAYCQAWVDRFELTNVELVDPTGATQIYFPGGSLPSTIIVDREGIIRFREQGASKGLVSLRAKLDELLAEMP
jgi:hypothetical protein